MKLLALDLDRLDEIVALVLHCDETWRPWAPLGWEPPAAVRERRSWEERLQGGRHWVRGTVDGNGVLVGVVSWQPGRAGGREGPEIPGVGYLGMLFVHPDAWGQGIGRHLLSAAEAAMGEAGCQVARLNVAERNPARAFYEGFGWVVAGAPEYSPGLDLPLVPYAKRLWASPRFHGQFTARP